MKIFSELEITIQMTSLSAGSRQYYVTKTNFKTPEPPQKPGSICIPFILKLFAVQQNFIVIHAAVVVIVVGHWKRI